MTRTPRQNTIIRSLLAFAFALWIIGEIVHSCEERRLDEIQIKGN